MEITVLALKFQQPIADLIDRLISRDYVKPREAGSGYYECSYSASAIILLVVMLESIIQRNRYFFLKNNPSIKTKSVAYGYLQETLHYRRHAQIQKLFELRNAIAHNHIWEIEHIWSNATGRQHKQSNLVPGTHKMRSPPLNSKIPRTKIVRFNLKPTRVDRTDLSKALEVSIHCLEYPKKNYFR